MLFPHNVGKGFWCGSVIGHTVDPLLRAEVDGRTPLHCATLHNHLEAAQLLLDKVRGDAVQRQGAHDSGCLRMVCAEDESGVTPLELASSPEMAWLLLDHGAEIKVSTRTDMHGNSICWSAIHEACRTGFLSVLECLMEHPTAVAALARPLDRQSWKSPMHVAAEFGHADIVALLLKSPYAGPMLDSYDCWGWNPLHGAASHNRDEAVRVLLSQGGMMPVEPTSKMEENCVPPRHTLPAGANSMHLAAAFGGSKVVQLLADMDPNLLRTKLADGRLPVHLALECQGEEETCLCLLQDIISPDSLLFPGDRRRTLLLSAARLGRLRIVELLLEKGSDPCWTDQQGCTPLWESVLSGEVVLVEYLRAHKLAAGDDLIDHSLQNPREDGKTLLHAAAQGGKSIMLCFLLDMGRFDINAQDVLGWSPLHEAAARGHLRAALTLLSQGADSSLRTVDGESYLDICDSHGHAALLPQLEAHDPRHKTDSKCVVL